MAFNIIFTTALYANKSELWLVNAVHVGWWFRSLLTENGTNLFKLQTGTLLENIKSALKIVLYLKLHSSCIPIKLSKICGHIKVRQKNIQLVITYFSVFIDLLTLWVNNAYLLYLQSDNINVNYSKNWIGKPCCLLEICSYWADE